MKIDTGTEELLCEISERVALVTLNKPDKKNKVIKDIVIPGPG